MLFFQFSEAFFFRSFGHLSASASSSSGVIPPSSGFVWC
jgi:hypothetical protein